MPFVDWVYRPKGSLRGQFKYRTIFNSYKVFWLNHKVLLQDVSWEMVADGPLRTHQLFFPSSAPITDYFPVWFLWRNHYNIQVWLKKRHRLMHYDGRDSPWVFLAMWKLNSLGHGIKSFKQSNLVRQQPWRPPAVIWRSLASSFRAVMNPQIE